MWKPAWSSFFLAFAVAAGAAGPAGGDATVATQRVGDDLLVAGGTVTVSQVVPGDLMVAGGNVDVDAGVAGDAIALGGKVRLAGDVGQSVYSAAGQLTIGGKVARNLRVAAGQVELAPASEILGNVSAAGGQVRLLGAVRGHVQSAAGRVLIDGPVGGDVFVASGQLELGPNARIAGQLRYRSRQPLLQDPAAQVAGGIVTQPAPWQRDDEEDKTRRAAVWQGIAAVFSGLWTLGLMVTAAALVVALPGFSARVSVALRQHLGASLLLGFVFLVCVPVAAVLVCLTLIGIPLGLFALVLYAALLPLAYAIAGIGLGDWALMRWLPERAGRLPLRVAAAATVLLALTLLHWVQVLGTLAGLLALLAGLGALLLQFRRVAPFFERG